MEAVRRFPFEASAERANGTFVLRLSGYCYPDNNNAAVLVAERLEALQPGDKLVLKLRDFYGGNVNEGRAIYEDLKVHEPDVQIDGSVCSMGTIIMLAGKHIVATPRSKGMTHRPNMGMGGDYEDLEMAAREGKEVQLEMAALYATRMGVKAEEAEATLMPKGQDKWWSAKQMKEMGLIDEVASNEVKAATVPVRELQRLHKPEDILGRWAATHIADEQPKTTNMKVIATLLGLADGATEEQIAEKLKSELAAKKTAEEAIAAHNTAEASRINGELAIVLDDGVKAKRITAAQKDEIVADAKVNPALALKMAKTLTATTVVQAPHVSVADMLATASAKTDTAQPEKDFGWFQKNQPEVLLKMSKENPAEFQRQKNEYATKLRDKNALRF